MTSDFPEHEIKALWRTQPAEPTAISLEEIRARARKFERRIQRRNRIEYVAAAIVVLALGCYVWVLPGWMIKLGSAMEIVAALYVVWRLHRHGAPLRPRADASAAALLEFHRAELVRQRNLLRTVWRWYLAPFVPGVALIFLGRWFQFHARGRPVGFDHLVIVLGAVIFALVFVIVGLLNTVAAGKLQRRIDDLDAFTGETEP